MLLKTKDWVPMAAKASSKPAKITGNHNNSDTWWCAVLVQYSVIAVAPILRRESILGDVWKYDNC